MQVEIAVDQLAAGLTVAWVLLWVMMSYTERGSDRQSTMRMGFYLSLLIVGAWVVLSVAVLGFGSILLRFLG